MCQTPPREWAWRGARLLGSEAGGEGPVADPRLQGYCPLSPHGAQQDRAVSGITTGLSQEEISPSSEVVPLLPAQESSPSQGWECPSALLPSHRRAAQKMLLAGGHQLSSTRREGVGQDRKTHPEREAGSAHNSHRHGLYHPGRTCGHTRRWKHCHSYHTYKCSDVCTLRQGDPNQPSAHPLSQHTYTYTYTHTHTHTRAHTDRYIWCFMDTHRPAHAQQPPTLHQPRVGAVLQPIWSPDPAGLSLSLGVGWGWGISPWRELISVVPTQQG